MVNSSSNLGSTRFIPAGISSMGRLLPETDAHPQFLATRAVGSRIWDDKNREFIDFIGGMGVVPFGHSRPEILEAIQQQLDESLIMPGLAHAGEELAAEAVLGHAPGFDWAVFLNSGSEATWSASQIARKKTGRRIVAKFSGGYHGWFGGLTFGKVGSAEAELESPTRLMKDDVALLRINDETDVRTFFAEYGSEVAAVIFEPIFANSGCIEPDEGFLELVASLADSFGALVILDQILTGFRYAKNLLEIAPGIEPDLMTLGKGIAGGAPVAAVLGKNSLRDLFESGQYVTAGTYNGNPLVTAAVRAAASIATEEEYERMNASGKLLRQGLTEVFAQSGIPLSTSGLNSVFSLWFSKSAPKTYLEALRASSPAFHREFHFRMREENVLVMPWRFGRFFVSSQHSADDIQRTLSAIDRVLADRTFAKYLNSLRQ